MRSPRRLGLILAGPDGVAVGRVMAEIAGMPEGQVWTTRVADEEGVGVGKLENIEVRGVSLEAARAKDFRLPGNVLLASLPAPVLERGLQLMKMNPVVLPDRCVRCGLCIKACPFNVLQPIGFGRGFDALWTPQVAADWAGCNPTCTSCGQVCPTGAIRALPLAEKRVARMGLAVVNKLTCLPHAGRGECDLCEKECTAAGYEAITFSRTPELDDNGRPIPDTGYGAPDIDSSKCVGCGLCQSRCYHINVKQRGILAESAIVIVAGGDTEDRLLDGSYLALRKEEQKKAESQRKGRKNGEDFHIPG